MCQMTSEDIKHHFIVYIKFTSFLVFNMCTPNNNKPAQTDTAADTAAENMSRSPDATQNLQVLLEPCNENQTVFENRLLMQSQPTTACASSSPVFLSLTHVHQTCTQTDTAAAPNTFRSPDATQKTCKFYTGTMQPKLCLKTGWWCSHGQQLHLHCSKCGKRILPTTVHTGKQVKREGWQDPEELCLS